MVFVESPLHLSQTVVRVALQATLPEEVHYLRHRVAQGRLVLDRCRQVVARLNDESVYHITHHQRRQSVPHVPPDHFHVNVIVCHLHQLFPRLEWQACKRGDNIRTSVDDRILNPKVSIFQPADSLFSVNLLSPIAIACHEGQPADAGAKESTDYSGNERCNLVIQY